jgi:hypothetical protein
MYPKNNKKKRKNVNGTKFSGIRKTIGEEGWE